MFEISYSGQKLVYRLSHPPKISPTYSQSVPVILPLRMPPKAYRQDRRIRSRDVMAGSHGMARRRGRNHGSGNQQFGSAQSLGCLIALARRVVLTLIDTGKLRYAPAIVIEPRHTIYYSPKYHSGPPFILDIASRILRTFASRAADIHTSPGFQRHSIRRYWLRRQERLLECRRGPNSKRPHASYDLSRTPDPAINQAPV